MARAELRQVAFRPPTLHTQRLVLRGWEPEDEAAIFAYASDPRVTPYMAWDRHQSIEDARTFLHEYVAANYRAGQLDYAICLREEPARAIGGMGIYLRSIQHQTAELGYVLAHDYWGRGFVPEAGRKLIDTMFRSSAVERIYAPIFGENEKSRKAASKMGMTLDGVLRQSICFRGVRRDEAVYSILRSEWAQASSTFASPS
jgi:ribosomal-protein-alanine N-acetyltransferase